MSGVGLAVSVRDLRAGYDAGPDVLRGVSLDVQAGEAVALLGPNGAGKTTLTRLVAGLLRPRAGRVAVGDWDTAGKRPDEMARRVGYAFQHADQQLFARTVYEDVAFGPRRLGREEWRVTAALEELGLLDARDVHPYDLPAPVRKLVTLAGVLAMTPAVLLLDEPTAGMDFALRDIVVRAVRRQAAEGVTILAVSHDLSFVAEIAERIVVLREGGVAADREAGALLTDRDALRTLGLRPPAAADIGIALGFDGAPIRHAEIVAQLKQLRWSDR